MKCKLSSLLYLVALGSLFLCSETYSQQTTVINIPGGCRHVLHGGSEGAAGAMNNNATPQNELNCSFDVNLDTYAPNFRNYRNIKVTFQGFQAPATRATLGWVDNSRHNTNAGNYTCGAVVAGWKDASVNFSAPYNTATTIRHGGPGDGGYHFVDVILDPDRNVITLTNKRNGIGKSRWRAIDGPSSGNDAAACISNVILELSDPISPHYETRLPESHGHAASTNKNSKINIPGGCRHVLHGGSEGAAGAMNNNATPQNELNCSFDVDLNTYAPGFRNYKDIKVTFQGFQAPATRATLGWVDNSRHNTNAENYTCGAVVAGWKDASVNFSAPYNAATTIRHGGPGDGGYHFVDVILDPDRNVITLTNKRNGIGKSRWRAIDGPSSGNDAAACISNVILELTNP